MPIAEVIARSDAVTQARIQAHHVLLSVSDAALLTIVLQGKQRVQIE